LNLFLPLPTKYDLTFLFLGIPVRISIRFSILHGAIGTMIGVTTGVPLGVAFGLSAGILWIVGAFVSIMIHELGPWAAWQAGAPIFTVAATGLSFIWPGLLPNCYLPQSSGLLPGKSSFQD
jgi:hypothetical protein